jgi:hypothetical protein
VPEPYRIKSGDTWPPLTVTVFESCDEDAQYAFQDDQGNWVRAVDLTSASQLRVVLRSESLEAVIQGVAENVEVAQGAGVADPDKGGAPANRGEARYIWQVGDTVDDNIASDWKGEVEVTWPGGPPPRIETFPVDPAKNFALIIAGDND